MGNKGVKNKKKIKDILVSFLMMLFFVFLQLTNVEAQTVKPLNLKVTNSITVIHFDNTQDIIPKEIPLEEVAIGAKLKIEFTITNYDEANSFNIGIIKKSGFQYLDYTQTDLKINGIGSSEEQYLQLIEENKLSTTLQNKMTISFYAKYTGVEDNLLSMNLSISSHHNESQYISSFDYSVDTKYKQKYLVNFYDDNSNLIESQVVDRNAYAKAPTIQREGYTFREFNTYKDGGGQRYKNEKVRNTADYYAIYDKKQFIVNYYIGEELYARELVGYKESAPELVVEKSELGKFIGWSENLSNITTNLNVYAKFEDQYGNVILDTKKEISKKGIRYLFMLIEKKTSSEISKYKSKAYITYVDDHEFIIGNKQESAEGIEMVSDFLSANRLSIFIYIIFLILVMIGYKKMKKARTKKEKHAI